MDIEFTVKRTAYFDLEQAYEDYYTILDFDPNKDPDSAIYDAVEENIGWPLGQDEYPNEVVEIAAKTLRQQIGGVQMRMELNEYEN